MRRWAILVLLVGACSFQPPAAGSGGDAGGGTNPGSGSGSGSGSGAGSGSMMDAGAGSGSAMVDAGCGDMDDDGVCDAQDAWPCGAEPSPPDSFVYVQSGASSWSAYSIQVGDGGQKYVATANQPFPVAFGYTISRPCESGDECPLELQYGTDLAGAAGCAWAGDVTGHYVFPLGDFGDRTASWNGMLTLTTPGTYQIRLDMGQEDSCPEDWAGDAPDDHATIAIVCVP